jgi:tetratricopeptide (TPR) repeat protein
MTTSPSPLRAGFLDRVRGHGMLAQMKLELALTSRRLVVIGMFALIATSALGIVGCGPSGPPPPITRPQDLDVDPLIRLALQSQVDPVVADPFDGSLRGRLAMAYEANELFSQAIEEYGHANTLAPADPLWPFRAAVCLLDRGDIGAGRTALEAVVARYPRFAPGWHRLAVIRLDESDLAGARSALDRCLQILPSALPAKATLADLHLRNDETAAAIGLLEEVTRTDPSNLQARFLLGRAYQRSGRDDPAVEVLLSDGAGAAPVFVADPREQQISSLESGLAVEMDRGIALLQAGRAREAEVQLERVHRYHPGEVSVLINLAQAHQQAGNAKGAISVLDLAASEEPENFRVHLVRAMIELTIGDAAANPGAAAVPGQAPPPPPNLSVAHHHFDEARKAARLAVRYGPQEWRTHFALGRASSRLKDLVEARQSLVAARELAPTNLEINMWLFETCWKLNDLGGSRAALESAVEADPQHIAAWVNLVHVRIAQGDADGAREALARAQQINPTHQRVIDAANKLSALPPADPSTPRKP